MVNSVERSFSHFKFGLVKTSAKAFRTRNWFFKLGIAGHPAWWESSKARTYILVVLKGGQVHQVYYLDPLKLRELLSPENVVRYKKRSANGVIGVLVPLSKLRQIAEPNI